MLIFKLVILLNDAYITKFDQILQNPKVSEIQQGNLEVKDI